MMERFLSYQEQVRLVKYFKYGMVYTLGGFFFALNLHQIIVFEKWSLFDFITFTILGFGINSLLIFFTLVLVFFCFGDHEFDGVRLMKIFTLHHCYVAGIWVGWYALYLIVTNYQ